MGMFTHKYCDGWVRNKKALLSCIAPLFFDLWGHHHECKQDLFYIGLVSNLQFPPVHCQIMVPSVCSLLEGILYVEHCVKDFDHSFKQGLIAKCMKRNARCQRNFFKVRIGKIKVWFVQDPVLLAGGPDSLSFIWVSSSASNDGYTFLINCIFAPVGKSVQLQGKTPLPVFPSKY